MNRSSIARLASLAAAVAAALLALASPAWAATFTVTKTSDTNDGTCNAADCSLREAIVAANTTPGADTVEVPGGTYMLSVGGRGRTRPRPAIWTSPGRRR